MWNPFKFEKFLLWRKKYSKIVNLIAILVVFVFALVNNQTVLKEFSLPLTIGVLVGTYSSIFIASSLWYALDSVVSKFSKDKKKKRR